MDCIPEKLYCLQTDAEMLKGMISDPVFQCALDDIKVSIKKITQYCSSVEQGMTEKDRSIQFYKRMMLLNLHTISPEWALWKQDETSLTFLQINILDGSILVKNRVNLELHWRTSEQVLVLTCKSSTNGVNFTFDVKPNELLTKMVDLLKCCFATSVCLERVNGTYIDSLIVKTEIGSDQTECRWTGEKVGRGVVVKQETDGVLRNNSNENVGNPVVVMEEHSLNNCDPDSSVASKNKTKKIEAKMPRPVIQNGIFLPESPTDQLPSGSEVNDLPGLEKLNSIIPDCLEPSDDHVDSLSDVSDTKATAKSKLPCRICNLRIDVRSGSTHLKIEHGISAVECCFCSSKFDSKEDLKIHRTSVHGKALRYSCRICGKYFPPSQGSEHLLREHHISGNECCFCPKTFDNSDDLKTHLRLYHWYIRKLNRRPCRLCNAPLLRKDELKHMKLEHDILDECPICDFKVGNVTDISLMDVADIVRTSQSVSSPQKQIQQHLSFAHSKRNERNWCRHCKISFRNKHLLRDHRKKCSNPKKSLVPKKILCNLCGKLIPYRNVSQHNAKHGEVGYQYACPQCPKKYVHGGGLKQHLLRHHFPERREFICNTCGKVFSDISTLKKHTRMHDQPKIKCTRRSCDKIFKWKSGVIQHLIGCHYPPEWECLCCHKRYSYRSVLRAHLKQIHHIVEIEEFVKKHPNDMSEDLAKLESTSDFDKT